MQFLNLFQEIIVFSTKKLVKIEKSNFDSAFILGYLSINEKIQGSPSCPYNTSWQGKCPTSSPLLTLGAFLSHGFSPSRIRTLTSFLELLNHFFRGDPLPRRPRKKSNSGIYHVMIRGTNQQIIFENDQDRFRFLQTLAKYKETCNYILYGYCLMDNHVHLLIKENEITISKIMQQISTSYARWFNLKYERSGHLFQGRFKSGTIENKHKFIRVLRYIHQNPIRANIENDVFACRWTSANEYLHGEKITETERGLKMFSENLQEAIQKYVIYMQILENELNRSEFLNEHCTECLTDEKLLQLLKINGFGSPGDMQRMEKAKRNNAIRKLKKIEGISIRQISRITGISKSVIHRVK